MRTYKLLGIQSKEAHSDTCKNWGCHSEGEAIYCVPGDWHFTRSESDLKREGFEPPPYSFMWKGSPMYYSKK